MVSSTLQQATSNLQHGEFPWTCLVLDKNFINTLQLGNNKLSSKALFHYDLQLRWLIVPANILQWFDYATMASPSPPSSPPCPGSPARISHSRLSLPLTGHIELDISDNLLSNFDSKLETSTYTSTYTSTPSNHLTI
jgi:hypothetical protein